jgi:hypothetical protein
MVEVRNTPIMRDLMSMDFMVPSPHHKTRSAAAKKRGGMDGQDVKI